jgi:hypothetical protein
MGEMRPLFGRKTETNDRSRKGAIIFLVLADGVPTSVGFYDRRNGTAKPQRPLRAAKEEQERILTADGR